MERYSLVVSDPPHEEIDALLGAELLGLAAAEVRMKAGFPAPEVWLALEDGGAAEAAAALRDVGLSVFAVSGDELATMPWSVPVSAFVFEADGLVVQSPDGELRFPYDIPITGVFGTLPPSVDGHGAQAWGAEASPRISWGRRSTSLFVERLSSPAHGRRQSGDSAGASTCLDLYLIHEGKLCRLSINDRLTDFSGLAEIKLPRARDNMVTCVLECGRRFPMFDVDTRLINVRPRRRPTVGSAGLEDNAGRKLFSFGTLGLMELLGSIDPELEEITHFELGSRLAYLAHQTRALTAPVAG